MSDKSEILRITVNFERLDAAAAPEFKRQLEEGMHVGHPRVLLDLGQVEFIDSTGLGVLVSLLKQMGPGGRIAVIGVRPAVARLFQITRLDSIFTLCGDEAEASRALAG